MICTLSISPAARASATILDAVRERAFRKIPVLTALVGVLSKQA